MNITILTPTYNRDYTLERLYHSLIMQTNKDFEWLIIDDGSIDKTKKLVDKFKKQNIIKINYIYKENGGKHTALNCGIKRIKNPLTFIVDSDDYLLPTAIETILIFYDKYKENKEIDGFSFLKEYVSGETIGDKYPKDEYIDYYYNCRINSKIKGDKAEVYFTNILRKYPFLEVPREKFLSEDYVWIQMGNDYKTVYINKSIYVAEYQNDGLTSNDSKVKKASPIGNSRRGLIIYNSKCNFRYRLKGFIMYIVYGLIGKKKIKDLASNSNNIFLFYLLLLPSFLYKIYLERKV